MGIHIQACSHAFVTWQRVQHQPEKIDYQINHNWLDEFSVPVHFVPLAEFFTQDKTFCLQLNFVTLQI